MAVGVQDRDIAAREEYPPPPARGGGELPGPPSRGPAGERETAEERAERRRRDEIRGVSKHPLGGMSMSHYCNRVIIELLALVIGFAPVHELAVSFLNGAIFA